MAASIFNKEVYLLLCQTYDRAFCGMNFVIGVCVVLKVTCSRKLFFTIS